MTLQQIEYFLSVARNLSFTKAAEELYTSQPTVSRQVSLLEEELGFPLLLRDRKSVRLTPGGVTMLAEFSRALEVIRDGVRRAERVSRGLEGRIAIGIREGMRTDYFVGPPTARFSQMYPGVVVSVVERSYYDLRRMLDEGTLDVIFTFDFELPYMQGILYEECYPVTAVVAMSRQHALAQKKDLQPCDCSSMTFLLPDPHDSAGREAELRSILNAVGCTGIKVEFVPNLNSLYMGVRAGRGLALLDSSTACIYDEHFCYLELPREQAPLSIVAAWKQDNLNPAIPLYLEVLGRVGEIDVFHN